MQQNILQPSHQIHWVTHLILYYIFPIFLKLVFKTKVYSFVSAVSDSSAGDSGKAGSESRGA